MMVSPFLRRSVMGMLLLAGLLLGTDATKDDGERIEGTWAATAIRYNGKDAPEQSVKQFKLVIDKKKITMQIGDKAVILGGYQLDASKKMRAIDIVADDGQAKFKLMEGIYELEGDK